MRHSPGAVGSPYRTGIEAAARQRTPTELRVWAHDLLEELEHRSNDSDPSTTRHSPAASVTTETIAVAGAVLDYLRDQPQGDGPGFRAWMIALDPLGLRAEDGVELLTFHAAKGREWHSVAVTGVETGLVPHRSATTTAGRSEEARLLYVAMTRAESQLLITFADRRGGYRRKLSPLLEGFTPEPTAVPIAPDDVLPERRRPRVDPILEALRAWRSAAARSANILPEQLCSDHVLREIAAARPASAAELAQVSGVGLLTAQRWHPAISTALASVDHEPGSQISNSAITGA
jgi:DNA helicase-2/ATP-dependent DNA helicase PcrA